MNQLLKDLLRYLRGEPYNCGKCGSRLEYKRDYGKYGCPSGCHPKHYPTNNKGD